MSEPMLCEVCENVGRRRMGRLSPEGWQYAEIVRLGEEYIVPVCSDRCRTEGWQPILIAPNACDGCGKPPTAQEGAWFYFPASAEPYADKDPRFSPTACSAACCADVWRLGPGSFDLNAG